MNEPLTPLNTSDIAPLDLEKDYVMYWMLRFKRALQDVRNHNKRWPPEKYIARDILNEFNGWLERKQKADKEAALKAKELPKELQPVPVQEIVQPDTTIKGDDNNVPTTDSKPS